MERLEQQVRLARRRMNLQRFLNYLPWCLFAALFVAAIAVLLRRWTVPELDEWLWNGSWIGGAVAGGLLAAVAWTWLTRHESLEAAIEIDRRFELKERVSSSLAISAQERETEAGRAVVDDAIRRVDRLDVNERFGIAASGRMLLPFVPAALAFLLAFALSDQGVPPPVDANTTNNATKKQVKKSSDELRKKIEKRRKQLAEKGLKNAEDVLKEINQGLEDLDKKTDGDRKQAMIKLNNLADKLQQRRKEMGGSDELRKQLNKMKDLEKGPADKLARAMKNGKMNAAMDEIQKLKNKLANGDLTEEEKKKLGQQMDQMQQKMQDTADAHQQAMDDLDKQIKSAMQSGDLAKAGQLQDALDRLKQQTPQMEKLREMASKLGRASQGMKQGDNDATQQALDELAADLDQMQQDLDDLANLDAALDEISECKNAMNCEQCEGQGCKACQGRGQGRGQGQGQGENGDGLGAGKAGRGDRPISEDDTATYESRVRTKVGPGKAVITGQADGPNAKGRVRDSIQAEFESQEGGPIDPLTGQRLPKSHQRHVEEYFQSLRDDGEVEDE